MECAGSLGDLGTLLPLATALIVINQVNPVSIFFTVGLFYIVTGLYFRVTTPVEPMKVISGYAIATGITVSQIQASCFWIFIILALLGLTGLINVFSRSIGKSVIRGVQLCTGMLLLGQGVKLIIGNSSVQQLLGTGEPYLSIQQAGPLPITIILGTAAAILIFLLLDQKKIPAALATLAGGIIVGLLFGTHQGWDTFAVGFHLPEILPLGLPTVEDFSFALLLLALPQIPMTVGNAVIANADLSHEYFKEKSSRVTNKALCLSMACGNFVTFFIAGIPLCHGAGGLASRYRFGARTGGSNIIIGAAFLVAALFLGPHLLVFIQLIPLSVLGALLIFAGAQLALMILDVKDRRELFVVLMILGITLASNLAIAFLIGIVLDQLLKSDRFSV